MPQTRALDIAGIGRCTLDLLFRLTEFPTWEKGVIYDDFSIDGGGQVGTGLVAASKLGASTCFYGTAGLDQAGDLKLSSLREWGVDTSKVVRRQGPDGQVILVTVNSQTGERVFTYGEHLDDEPLRQEELNREQLMSAEYLLIDGSHQDAALQGAKWMHQEGKHVMLDGSRTSSEISNEIKALIPYVDTLICGDGFAQQLTGVQDIYGAGEAVLEMGPSLFVQTLGESGSYTVTRGEKFHTPSFSVEVKDTTGAGDVFHGAYLYGLLQGWDPRRCAVFSSATSAIKCTRMGGRKGAPTLGEVTSFLETHSSLV